MIGANGRLRLSSCFYLKSCSLSFCAPYRLMGSSTDISFSKAKCKTEFKRAASSGKPFFQGVPKEWVRTVFHTWQRGVVMSVGIAMGISATIYILWRPLHSDTVHQTAKIASQALEDERLKERAIGLSRAVVIQILQDNKSIVLLAELISKLLNEDESRRAVTGFIHGIFEDKYMQEITKKFVLQIITDPWVEDQLHHIFLHLTENLLVDPRVADELRQRLINSAVTALQDPELQAQTGRTVRSVVWKTIFGSPSSRSESVL